MHSKRSSGPASVRLEHVLRLLRHRYGPTLAGLDDADLLVQPIAALLVATRRERGLPADDGKVIDRLAELAPSIDRRELEVIVTRALASARPWSTSDLGEHYRVTVDERETLKLWQLRPAGMTADQWRAAQRERERERGERRRREKGKQTRESYIVHAAAIKRLAVEHNVSTQTIRNWIKKGRIASPSGFQTAEFESPSGFQTAEFESPSGFQTAEFESPSGRKAEQADELQNQSSNTSKAEREPSSAATLYDKQAPAQAPQGRGAPDVHTLGKTLLRSIFAALYSREFFDELDDSLFWRMPEIAARLIRSYPDLWEEDLRAAADNMAIAVVAGKSIIGDSNSEAAALRAVARQRFEKMPNVIPF